MHVGTLEVYKCKTRVGEDTSMYVCVCVHYAVMLSLLL